MAFEGRRRRRGVCVVVVVVVVLLLLLLLELADFEHCGAGSGPCVVGLLLLVAAETGGSLGKTEVVDDGIDSVEQALAGSVVFAVVHLGS